MMAYNPLANPVPVYMVDDLPNANTSYNILANPQTQEDGVTPQPIGSVLVSTLQDAPPPQVGVYQFWGSSTSPDAPPMILSDGTIIPLIQGGTGTALGSGTAGQFIQSNGNGMTSWATPSGGGNVTGPGSVAANSIASYSGTTGTLLGSIPIGTNGQVLTSNGTIASFQTPISGGGNVTGPQTVVSGNLTFFNTTSGQAISDSGVAASSLLTTQNVVTIVQGGTGETSRDAAIAALLPAAVAIGTMTVWNGSAWVIIAAPTVVDKPVFLTISQLNGLPSWQPQG